MSELDPRVPPTSAAGFSVDMSVYERGRPSYPADAVAWLVGGLGIGPGADVVDLAAGTGKFTRLLVPTGARIVAVEPSAPMRAELARTVPGVEAVDGTAEALPLADGSVDAVVAAQAFHWFDVPRATAEIARVLRPGGGLGFVWNERDASVPWVAEISDLIGWDHRDQQGVPFNVELDWRQIFADHAVGFGPLERFDTTYRQELDEDTLVERVLSSSYIAVAPADEQARIAAGVRAIVAGFPERFELPYITVAYRCRRA